MSEVTDQLADPIVRRDASGEFALDDLHRQLRRAEAAIRRRAFGVSARVVLRTGFDEEGGGEWQECLCFGKHEGDWRLHLESGFADRPESLQARDLFAAHVDTRSLAAKKVPVLVQALEAVELRRGDDPSALARELASFVDRLARADG